ncbi:MAG TPA: 50S ribosomal protein L29 [Candidatus Binatia bacterium]|jgi:large subunit ribosomal protein L29
MEPKELRDSSDEELEVRERELKESLFLLRLRHKTNQLESPARLAQTRRDIARISTIRRERELERNR